jgi:hypothetical protein
MRKTLSVLGLTLAALFVGGNAYGQCDRPPIGTPYTCFFTNGGKVVIPDGGGPAPSNSSGSATVYVIGYNDNPCEILLSPDRFASTGSGEFGRIGSSLAPGSPVSRLTGPDGTTSYPARLELNLNLNASVPSLGSQTFTSEGPLTLIGDGIPSLPFKGVALRQEKPVHFSSPKQDRGFTLDQVNVVLNR